MLARIEALPAGKVPALRRVFGALGEEGARYDFDAGFEVGLDILVGGIEAIADEGSGRDRIR